ncbi:SRPBCC family protein [Azospirillum sp. ST 5-10]|uniref:SRPBCC family protein n=1 Tax=unclassified Azospirillum TaxID=2630922 RepID=UPI003F4A6A2B
MELTGSYRIPAHRERVFAALCDAQVLKSCVPVCEHVTRLSRTEYAARVMARIGPLKVGFDSRLTVDPVDPPRFYILVGEGRGGLAGMVKAMAHVRLEEADGGHTHLTYTATADLGGRIAALAGRLVRSSATGYADRFFARFTEAVLAFEWIDEHDGGPDAAPPPRR